MVIPVFILSTSETLLCGVLADCEPEEWKETARRFVEELGDEHAFELAQANGVSSIVAHALIDAYGAEDVPLRWVRVHEENFRRISAYLAELDRVAEKLAGESIRLVVLKNGGIARSIYPCPGCCPMGDLDILVEKRHFRRAHKILLDDGYQFEFRSPLEEAKLEVVERDGGAEYWKILPGGEKLWIELQWRPVAGRWIRPDQEPSTEELMARSVPILGTAVRLLAPEDNLLQMALHTAKHSYVRAPGFRLHLDIDHIVRRQMVDWDVFVNRVMKLQVKTPVFFSLALPKVLFGTPVPDAVLDDLKPDQWKISIINRWLQSAGLFNPDEQKFGRIGYVLFNALLYDDLRGLVKAGFPDRVWMSERYGIKSCQHLPLLYLKRLLNLTFRRNNT